MWRPLAWWILTWAALYNTPGYPLTSDLSHLILSVLTGEGDNVDKKVWTSIHLFYPSPTYFLWKLFTKINWADYWMKLILGLVDSTIKAKDYEVIEGPDCNVVRNDESEDEIWSWRSKLGWWRKYEDTKSVVLKHLVGVGGGGREKNITYFWPKPPW